MQKCHENPPGFGGNLPTELMFRFKKQYQAHDIVATLWRRHTIFQRQMCSGQTRHRHPVGAAGHVVKARAAAEVYRFGVAAMFAADRQGQV
jgi:hypothetical protein